MRTWRQFWTAILIALVQITGAGAIGYAMRAKHPPRLPKVPALGAVSAPVHFQVSIGGAQYIFDSNAITFTPSGSETKRALSGTGTLTLVIPPPPLPPNPPPPGPPPGPTLNVRDFGVKGDGTTVDVPALNNLIRTAPDGAVLYFPAGTYVLNDALKIFRSNLSFVGDGDAAVLKSIAGSYHVQIGSGAQVYRGLAFSRLQFLGTPGQYMADGTSRGGVLCFGCSGTQFRDCLFRGCAEPILGAGPIGTTAGTIVDNCRFFGWGRMCIFCNGGERITNCRLIQDDPNLFGERSSHGFYIHGGASNVVVADTEIAGARKYALQIYSESAPSVTDNVQLLRLNIHDCANGIITAHGNPTAGRLTNGLIQGCTIKGTYAGSAIAVKNGDGVKVLDNTIDGSTGAAAGHTGAGIYFGVWAPYEPNFTLANVVCQNNSVHGCDRGIWTLPSNGGLFTNILISGNHVAQNRQDYDITGPNVTMVPGRAAAGPGKRRRPAKDSGGDSRPHDDSRPVRSP